MPEHYHSAQSSAIKTPYEKALKILYASPYESIAAEFQNDIQVEALNIMVKYKCCSRIELVKLATQFKTVIQLKVFEIMLTLCNALNDIQAAELALQVESEDQYQELCELCEANSDIAYKEIVRFIQITTWLQHVELTPGPIELPNLLDPGPIAMLNAYLPEEQPLPESGGSSFSSLDNNFDVEDAIIALFFPPTVLMPS